MAGPRSHQYIKKKVFSCYLAAHGSSCTYRLMLYWLGTSLYSNKAKVTPSRLAAQLARSCIVIWRKKEILEHFSKTETLPYL